MASRRLWKCDDCDFRFPANTSDGDHLGVDHARQTGHLRNRCCRACQRIFKDAEAHGQHMRSSRHDGTAPGRPPAHASRPAQPAAGDVADATTSGPNAATVSRRERRSRHGAAFRGASIRPEQTRAGGGPSQSSRPGPSAAAPAPALIDLSETVHPKQTARSIAASKYAADLAGLQLGSGSEQAAATAWKAMERPDVSRWLDPVPGGDWAGPTDEDKGRRRSRKVAMPKPVEEFKPPREYPVIGVSPMSYFTHGGNQYTLYRPEDHATLAAALALRCHNEARLRSHKFVLAKMIESEGLILPKGAAEHEFASAPPPDPRAAPPKRRVVALDCEMVGVLHAETGVEISELAQLCAVDVLTGETLVNRLVRPRGRVISWRTRFSGITQAAMAAATARGETLAGWRGAREELFKFIDADSIVVGHVLTNDLHVLRLLHGRVIDTSLQTGEAVCGDVERVHRIWGLKELAEVLLARKIQAGEKMSGHQLQQQQQQQQQQGGGGGGGGIKRGHDCVEDTLATRELALWCVCRPDALAAWAGRMREMLEAQRAAREEKREQERRARAEREAREEAEMVERERMLDP